MKDERARKEGNTERVTAAVAVVDVCVLFPEENEDNDVDNEMECR